MKYKIGDKITIIFNKAENGHTEGEQIVDTINWVEDDTYYTEQFFEIKKGGIRNNKVLFN